MDAALEMVIAFGERAHLPLSVLMRPPNSSGVFATGLKPSASSLSMAFAGKPLRPVQICCDQIVP